VAETAILQQIIDILVETVSAHHEAFGESGGIDPEWPLWYAQHTREALCEALGANFTLSELVYLYLQLDGELRLRAPGAYWPAFYAKSMVERYLVWEGDERRVQPRHPRPRSPQAEG
jgi:hypothetical protein